jgi:vacuolar-type H+-ATPase subunit C/Vma6
MVLDPRYAYMSAYLKAEEPKMVGANHMDRLSRVTSVPDAIGIIRETDIGAYLEGVTVRGFDDIDAALWQYLANRIAHVEAFKYLPDDMRKVSRAYVVKFDVANVKSTLQGIATGDKTPLLPLGVIHDSGFSDDLQSSETVQDVADILTRSRLADLAPVVKGYDPSGGAKAKIALESRLESEYYHGLLKTSRVVREGSSLAKAYGLVIDLANLGIVSRAVVEGIGTAAADFLISDGYIIDEKMLRDVLPYKLPDIPRRIDLPQYRELTNEVASAYDKVKSVTVIDEVIERHKFATLRDLLSPRVLSPLVMAWYLVLKEIEVRNVRLVLKAIYDGVAVEDVKRYLLL